MAPLGRWRHETATGCVTDMSNISGASGLPLVMLGVTIVLVLSMKMVHFLASGTLLDPCLRWHPREQCFQGRNQEPVRFHHQATDQSLAIDCHCMIETWLNWGITHNKEIQRGLIFTLLNASLKLRQEPSLFSFRGATPFFSAMDWRPRAAPTAVLEVCLAREHPSFVDYFHLETTGLTCLFSLPIQSRV